MRRGKNRPPSHQMREGLLDRRLGCGIKRGCCLVKQENWSVNQEGPGDPQTLALTFREPHSSFTDYRFISLRKFLDKLIAPRRACRQHDVCIRGIWATVADVFQN